MGLGFVALGFVLVALGYGFPTWVRRSSRKTQGLWHVCGRQWSSCSFFINDDGECVGCEDDFECVECDDDGGCDDDGE